MRTKNPETMNQIKEFVDKYYFENNKSPSVRKIANGIGIVGSTAFRYLQEMNEKGMLVYDGKSVTTEKIGKFNTKTVCVPIVRSITGGISLLADENIDAYVSLPETIFGTGSFYILRAKGLSMIEAGICDGDLILIRNQDTADNGNIVVAIVDGEATLKRYYKEKDYVRLHPENKNMEDIIVQNCKIQGVAVKIIKNLIQGGDIIEDCGKTN